MKRIGIFIGYAPHEVLRKEGLGRLLAFILKGFAKNPDVQTVIVSPMWYRDIILDLLDDHDIDANAVQLLTTSRIPILMRIAQWRGLVPKGEGEGKDKPVPAWQNSLAELSAQIGRSMTDIRISLWSAAGLTAIPVIFLSILIIAPLVSVLALATLLWRAVSFGLNLSKRGASFVLRPFRGGIASAIDQLVATGVGTRLYTELSRKEIGRVVKLANLASVDGWYIPSMFWPEIEKLKARRVMAGPDMVFVEFPTFFNYPHSLLVYDSVAQSLAAADHIISYSNYVANENLSKVAEITADRVSIVPHGQTCLDDQLALKLQGRGSDYLPQVARQILVEYQTKHLWSDAYWRTIDLWSIDYVIYSSQNRPYKNIINLIKAIQRLRAEGLNVRLLITARYDGTPLGDYIAKNQLETIVWSAHDVSSKVLAALNYFARCSVNPTLFEGGFPFTFTEAYSVGTPSVMSRIPMTVEKIGKMELSEIMLFDPYDIKDMAEKIRYACDHREQLLELQKPLFDDFESWNVVAQRYVDIISGEGFAPVVRRKVKKLKRQPPRDRLMVNG